MASKLINKHFTNVLAAGGTIADAAWLSTIESWLISEGLMPYLMDWANPAIGVVKNGSNHISQIMGLGSTWLPRIGGLTPIAPSSTVYDATAINGLPGWTNNVNTAYSYYGKARGGFFRTNNIRRKHYAGLTVVGVYKKPGTAVASLFGMGQFGGMYLQHTSGASGQCRAFMGQVGGGGPTAATATHATVLPNAAVNIIGFTFDQQSGVLTPYVEGLPGTTATFSQQYNPMMGAESEVSQRYKMFLSGSSTATYVVNSDLSTSISGNVNEALFSMGDLITINYVASGGQMASLNALLRGRYGP